MFDSVVVGNKHTPNAAVAQATFLLRGRLPDTQNESDKPFRAEDSNLKNEPADVSKVTIMRR
jgi:hypothetical protein